MFIRYGLAWTFFREDAVPPDPTWNSTPFRGVAGELGSVAADVRRAAETPFNIVMEGRPS